MNPTSGQRFRPATLALTLSFTALVSAPAVLAAQEIQPTSIMVRVLAHDAKLIGTGVGGAHILIRDVQTGEVLAEGTQEGGTGDTDLIMGARERGATVFDTEGAAGFRAEIPLTVPTTVEIVARGPLGTPHATQRANTTLLMIPGVDMVGEGVVLTLYGFTVEMQRPSGAGFRVAAGEEVPVRARVTMLCGCPTEPGGLWDADDYAITAQWVRDGRVLDEAPLAWAGTTSEYLGGLTAPATPGPVTLRILAVDPGKANAGMVETMGAVITR